MECSLVIINGETPKKLKAEDYSDVAELAGLKFIKTQHVKRFGNTTYSIRGFQGAAIKVDRNNMEQGYRLQLSTDRNSNATTCLRPLEYNPDPISGALLGLIPDTEYNRHKLAAAYNYNPFCIILDKDIDKEISAWADEIEKTLPKGKTVEEVAIEAVEENEKLKAQLKRERSLREAAEEGNLVVENARKRIDEQRKTPAKAKKAKPVKEEPKKEPEKPKVDEGKIMTEVLNEYKDDIDELKLKHKNLYRDSEEYRDTILPEITRRIKEANYVNGSTGVSDKDKK